MNDLNLEELMRNDFKVYVDVYEYRRKDGTLLPISLFWDEDGERKRYKIDRITDIRPAASLKAGGAGIRYAVEIREKLACMFLENDGWFAERR